jgi:hypothetical protein
MEQMEASEVDGADGSIRGRQSRWKRQRQIEQIEVLEVNRADSHVRADKDVGGGQSGWISLELLCLCLWCM